MTSGAALARRDHRVADEHVLNEHSLGEHILGEHVLGEHVLGDVRTLVAAARRLDGVAATAIVTATLARRGVTATWNQLCRPALAALDNPDGSTGPDSCIAAELTLSRAITTSLHRLPTPPTAPDAPRVLLACAEGEHHTLGRSSASTPCARR